MVKWYHPISRVIHHNWGEPHEVQCIYFFGILIYRQIHVEERN